MSVTSIDSNTWYSITSGVSSSGLTWNTSAGNPDTAPIVLEFSTTTNWQFLDIGVASGGDASQTYLIRPVGYSSWCIDVSDYSVILDQCYSNTVQWQADFNTTDDGTPYWFIYFDSSSFLAADAAANFVVDIEGNESEGASQNDAGWDLSSASQINDPSWSTLPWTSSTTTSVVSTTSTIIPVISTTSTASSPISTTSSAVITTSPTATYSNPPSVPSTTFSASIIDKSIRDIKDLGIIPSLLLPQEVNFGCENCSISGNAGVASGGCSTTSDSLPDLEGCVEYGYVDIAISDIYANMSLDIQLLPGFDFFDSYISFVNVSLGSVQLSDKLSLNFTLDFGIPLIITLDTPVTFFGGFTLDLPEAAFRFQLDDIANSNISGFENAIVEPLPFHVSGPNATLSFITGLSLRLHCDPIFVDSDVNATGMLTFEAAVPRVNFTTTLEEDVDGQCHYDSGSDAISHAVNLLWDVEVGIYPSGELEVDADVLDHHVHKDWNGDIPPWSYTLWNNSSCLYGSELVADFKKALGELEGGAGGRTRGGMGWWWMGLCGAVMSWLVLGL